MAFAHRTAQELHWYYAKDTHLGQPLTDRRLKDKLERLNSGRTNQRPGKIPLVLGMPVLISQNFDVEGGIVNGSKGILKQIRYRIDADGHRHAVSCVVHVADTSDESLPHLPQHHVVVLEDTTDL
ncbi:hypothetical protein BD410DRAFT_728891, partial [Rickenella mellea]